MKSESCFTPSLVRSGSLTCGALTFQVSAVLCVCVGKITVMPNSLCDRISFP